MVSTAGFILSAPNLVLLELFQSAEACNLSGRFLLTRKVGEVADLGPGGQTFGEERCGPIGSALCGWM